MTELEIITTAVSGLTVLAVVLLAAAAAKGWLEASVTLKVVPPWKRRGPERAVTATGAQEAVR